MPPQNENKDSEDNQNSESEADSEEEEESDEEERDEDVDPNFRQQLMAVLQAGKALVSRSQGRDSCMSGCLCPPEARLKAGPLSLRVKWMVRRMRRS